MAIPYTKRQSLYWNGALHYLAYFCQYFSDLHSFNVWCAPDSLSDKAIVFGKLPTNHIYTSNIASCFCLWVVYRSPQLNLSLPIAGYMRQRIGSALVQIMACRLFGAKPLSKAMLSYCHLDPNEQTSVKCQLKYKNFHSRNCIWKYRLRSGGHFIEGEMRYHWLPMGCVFRTGINNWYNHKHE